MDSGKRIAESSYTNRDASESPRTHEGNVSAGTKEIVVRKSKKPKMTTLMEEGSSSRAKWSKEEEILILLAIIDFLKVKGLNYKSNYDAFYRYAKEEIKEAKFTKKQLVDKIDHLRKKFLTQSTSNTDESHDELFNLSASIWGGNETPTENSNQPKDVPIIAQQEQVPIVIETADKEEEGIDHLPILQEIINAQEAFSDFGPCQKMGVLERVGKLDAGNQKKYIDEWNKLVLVDLQQDVKKKSYSAMLFNGEIPPF